LVPLHFLQTGLVAILIGMSGGVVMSTGPFFAVSAIAALAALATPAAQAQTFVTRSEPLAKAAALSDADIVGAKPLTPKLARLPASASDVNSAMTEASITGVQVNQPGKRPTVSAAGLMQKRELSIATIAMADDEVQPDAFGTGGIHFTSSRTYPRNQDWTYPSSTVGKLFIRTASGATGWCSASVLRPGVVVTAGHCVHNGNCAASGWYTGFTFVPGYSRVGTTETRPLLTWDNWAEARTTSTWACGGGGVPNAGDWALIVFRPNSSGYRVGNYTGYLGYQYPSMIGRHMTVLGYPGNHDSGNLMHRVDSMATNAGTNNGAFGSDMSGGSSGSPVVLNWRQDYLGLSPYTQDNGALRVTSVVSWGYGSPYPQVQGGAQFDANFGALLSASCSANPGAC
jgi:V8-like Glu-specific endopeptidase